MNISAPEFYLEKKLKTALVLTRVRKMVNFKLGNSLEKNISSSCNKCPICAGITSFAFLKYTEFHTISIWLRNFRAIVFVRSPQISLIFRTQLNISYVENSDQWKDNDSRLNAYDKESNENKT